MMAARSAICVALLCGVLCVVVPAAARDVRILTWNFKDFGITGDPSVKSYARRKDDLKNLVADARPDIILLQEIGSAELLKKMQKEEAFLKTFPHFIVSEYQPGDGDRESFEVAILSKFPISQWQEFDAFPEGTQNEAVLDHDYLTGELPDLQPLRAARGVLWAKIDSIKLTLINLHLRSSRDIVGKDDEKAARQRETVAARAVLKVAEDQRKLSGYSSLVAGDFNVGYTDYRKNGKNLGVDSFRDPPQTDGYDDTHHLFEGGVVHGLRMDNLCKDLGSSFWDPQGRFARMGPIDNIYVKQRAGTTFSKCQKVVGKSDPRGTYNSDHFPVLTVMKVGGTDDSGDL